MTTGITYLLRNFLTCDRLLAALPLSRSFFTSVRTGTLPLSGHHSLAAIDVVDAANLEEPMQSTMSLRDVAALLNVKPYRVEYLLANGIVPEPEQRIAGRRVFTPEIVRLLAARLKVTLPAAETAAEPAAELVGV